MKKLCLLFILSIGFVLGGSTLSVYAEELPEQVVVETETTEEVEIVETEQEIEEYASKVTEYIIAGVMGLLGTSALAIAFRKTLKSLGTRVLEAIGLLKSNKDEVEEDINMIVKSAQKTVASLEKLEEKILNANEERFLEMELQMTLLCKVIIYMAGGMKELVVNGTSESISNLLKQFDKEVNLDGNEEV
jgi:ethanolamine utilization cobalamin adenosyltransferase